MQEAAGASTPATATSGNSAFWAAQAIALTPLLSSSITVTPPTGYVAGSGDLMLVSIAAQGLSGGSICAPDSTWTKIPVAASTYTTTSGTLTQEAFWTNSSTAASDSFTFYPGSTCSGTPTNVGASAVATVYTGIDPTTPIDSTYAASASGTSSPLHAAAITPTVAGDEIVALFGTNAATLTGTSANATSTGGVTSSGVNDSLDAGTTSYTPPGTVTSTPTGDNWTAETVALKPLSAHGITIARPSSPDRQRLSPRRRDRKRPPGRRQHLRTERRHVDPGEHDGDPGNDQPGALLQRPDEHQRRELHVHLPHRRCPAGGSAVGANATAIAVRYAGVNPVTPIDNNGTDIYAKAQGSSATIAPAGTTANPHGR